jgi:alpha/beta superfamily hydrolase
MPTLFFAHGKESNHLGLKIQRLSRIAQAYGYTTLAPDFSSLEDPEARVQKLLAEAPHDSDGLVLVGSSMGGYVVTVASAILKPRGLFLMAPAFYREGYAEQDPHPYSEIVTLVHGWRDTVVPLETSVRFAGLYRATLHIIDSDHRLHDRLEQVEELFTLFLKQTKDEGR